MVGDGQSAINDGTILVGVDGAMRKTGLVFAMAAFVLIAPGGAASAPSPPEILNQDGLFGEEDYPAEAIMQELEGQTDIRLTINANGRVQACQVIQSSGHEVLDQATCAVYQTRGEFRPARNRQGRAVVGKLVRHVTWRLDRSGRPMAQEFRFQAEFRLGADRRMSNCTANLLSSGREQTQPCVSVPFGGSGLFSALAQAGFTGAVDVRGVLVAMRTQAELEKYFVPDAEWTLLARQNAVVSVNDEGTAQDCVITQGYGPTSANLPLCSFADTLSFRPRAEEDGGERQINIAFAIFVRPEE